MTYGAWICLLSPLAAAGLITLGGERISRRGAGYLATLSCFVAFAGAVTSFVGLLGRDGGQRTVVSTAWTWITGGSYRSGFALMIDPLSVFMMLIVAGVGALIVAYSIGYMDGDNEERRYFAYMALFVFSMLLLVQAGNFVILLAGWGLVGLSSYLLIGFWHKRPAAVAAAKKAFVMNAVGDATMALALFLLIQHTGTIGFNALPQIAHASDTVITVVALGLLGGAVAKSAQLPLHTWLPDAMEGPTPVSALIHAATMVAAGVFLVARVYPIFSLGAIDGVTSSLTVVVWIGVITALMAALIAITQADIKRILAYSTVSQLGLMMVSLGVGGVAAGMMHLLAHGFFKALLFLGAGSVIHGCHGEQDIRRMGGLRRLMPVTFSTYAIGMMALSGVPLFFSGGWTKEEILHVTAHWPASRLPYYFLLAGVVLTALYMTRQIIYVFFGDRRAASQHAHESPRVMTMPLIVLGSCAILFSVLLTPAWPWLHHYLTDEPAHFEFARLIQPTLFLSLVLVGAGVAFGIGIYRKAGAQDRQRPADIDPLEFAQAQLFRFLENKMWIDELYARTVIAFSWMSARLSDWMDRHFWDRLVRGFGAVGQLFGTFATSVDERGINAGVDETTVGTRGLGRLMSAAHSGQIQTYLGVIAIGLLALLLFYAWLA